VTREGIEYEEKRYDSRGNRIPLQKEITKTCDTEREWKVGGSNHEPKNLKNPLHFKTK
jgi:hypothetical protein